MIKQRTSYKHNRTGKIILVVEVFPYLDVNLPEGNDTYDMCHVLADGRWTYRKASIIAKNYHEITWQEAHGVIVGDSEVSYTPPLSNDARAELAQKISEQE